MDWILWGWNLMGFLKVLKQPVRNIENIWKYALKWTRYFDEQLISNLIVALSPYKAHSHNGLSIRMLQMGSDSISKTPSIIFRDCLKVGYFPTAWKKANVVPVYKKGNKQILNNYRPVSLLHICSKLFEKIIFDTIF